MYALAALAILAVQEPTDLLPPTPESWRFERLEFPLSFAPDLDYQGFEELRFAPGMFDAGAETYWTYILGIRLEQDVEIDRTFVQHFLERYYRGLCEAVGADRDPPLDLSLFAVDVRGAGPSFTASIDMVDPFVTGERLVLELELRTAAHARSTELLGIASPLAKDEPIWKELRAMATEWQSERPVPVFLNHLFVVLDQETYDALRTSNFLRGSFASSEERETIRRDTSYSGAYFYGQDTYFEFLPPGAMADLAEGSSGLAFGIEVGGGTDTVSRELTEAGVQTFVGPVTRQLGDEHVPWFQIIGMEAATTSSKLSTFSLEYDPHFLERWHPDSSSGAGISRREVLARYAAKLDQSELHANGLLEDVTAVSLALDDAERARLVRICETFGYAVEQREDGWVCDGPQVTLRIERSDGPGGITGLEMSLRRPVEKEPMQMGTARLSFAGRAATLEFAR